MIDPTPLVLAPQDAPTRPEPRIFDGLLALIANHRSRALTDAAARWAAYLDVLCPTPRRRKPVPPEQPANVPRPTAAPWIVAGPPPHVGQCRLCNAVLDMDLPIDLDKATGVMDAFLDQHMECGRGLPVMQALEKASNHVDACHDCKEQGPCPAFRELQAEVMRALP